MRVCLITGEFPPMQGGVGDYTHELGRALVQRGVEVCVLTSTGAAGAATVFPVLPVVSRWGWGCWRTVLDVLRRRRPDVVHIQYQTAAYGMHPAINFLPLRLRWTKDRPRVVVTFHDVKIPYLFPKAGPVRDWLTLAIARWSDAAVPTNAEDYQWLRAAGLDVPLYLIPIGSNVAPVPPAGYDRAAWRARYGVGPDDLLLSYFGFLNESKGGEALIQTLDRLLKSGYNTHLLMVGGRVGSSDPTNVAYARKVEALIEQLNLTERVHWTGYTAAEEVTANLWASDVCVLPYRDGASFRRGSFMAALVHGRPIVSTTPRVPLPELVDGQNIALAPPDDPAALAARVAALADDPALRQRLAAGAQALSRRFEWGSIAEQTIEVYRALGVG